MAIKKNDKIYTTDIVFQEIQKYSKILKTTPFDERYYNIENRRVGYPIYANQIKLREYNYTSVAGENGTVSGSGKYTVFNTPDYIEYDIIATPNNKYKIDSWSVSGGSDARIIGETGKTTATTGKLHINKKCYGDITVRVGFKIANFRVTVVSGGNGSVSGTTTFEFEPKTTQQTISITTSTSPNPGYKFNKYTTNVGSISGTTLTIPANTQQDITVTANFIESTYSINKGSYISGGSRTTYTYNPSSDITSTGYSYSRTGWTFNSWSTNRGSMSGSGSSGTLTIPAGTYGDITISVYASANTYEIKNGNIYTTLGATSYTYSDTIQYIYGFGYTSRSGYDFIGFTASNGCSCNSSGRLTIPAGTTGIIQVTANYEEQVVTKTITRKVNNTSYGYYTSGATSYDVSSSAQSKTYKVQTYSGYKVTDWSVDSTSQSGGVKFTTKGTGSGSISCIMYIPANYSKNITLTCTLAEDITYSRVGGTIFYVDSSASSSGYRFFKSDKTEITGWSTYSDLADAYYYYKPSGVVSNDKIYVYDTNGFMSIKTRWTYYSTTDGNWKYEDLETYNVSTGKENTQKIMDKDSGAYIKALAKSGEEWSTVWYKVDAYNSAGYQGCSDWYIGTKQTYNTLRTTGLIDFSSQSCWASDEVPGDRAYSCYYWSNSRWYDSGWSKGTNLCKWLLVRSF